VPPPAANWLLRLRCTRKKRAQRFNAFAGDSVMHRCDLKCVACRARAWPTAGSLACADDGSRVRSSCKASRLPRNACVKMSRGRLHRPQLRDHTPLLRRPLALPARSLILSRSHRHECVLLSKRASAANSSIRSLVRSGRARGDRSHTGNATRSFGYPAFVSVSRALCLRRGSRSRMNSVASRVAIQLEGKPC
jgi:hypothetical protein